ncbi:hypothetical protein [uncultured Ruegeria sp.]|uniref:hypothetical protein n=1 Tax=uncultured Ruegeria sp. TaxID=259304 RepID=UPI00260389CC|nr:hypothetical protein [uncultured Ruegeria sp.]
MGAGGPAQGNHAPHGLPEQRPSHTGTFKFIMTFSARLSALSFPPHARRVWQGWLPPRFGGTAFLPGPQAARHAWRIFGPGFDRSRGKGDLRRPALMSFGDGIVIVPFREGHHLDPTQAACSVPSGVAFLGRYDPGGKGWKMIGDISCSFLLAEAKDRTVRLWSAQARIR